MLVEYSFLIRELIDNSKYLLSDEVEETMVSLLISSSFLHLRLIPLNLLNLSMLFLRNNKSLLNLSEENPPLRKNGHVKI